MSNKETGGPAFPSEHSRCQNGREDGMTLRDYFAGEALSGLVASCTNDQEVTPRLAAKWCYEMADAMLEARKQ
ncbi:hypothetical protein [Rhodoferax mekongensis]|uniref:Uncharacterized protein n=1 Tax=Rhodoferax mekongensis TaxID=3068341 RepID=A0ABZ0B253_9BURK|nr:hypothetical protein [Rhodoferax sp. TBRC 17307]WNO06000.1 hypothetical protein RAN89_06110 [Rhodoferax sp. TBRC 17307]